MPGVAQLNEEQVKKVKRQVGRGCCLVAFAVADREQPESGS
jgi:hypothetical protein